MEDDDEFGDLYTDVLRPIQTSFQCQRLENDVPAPSQSRPIDLNVNSDNLEILYGAPNLKNSDISNSAFGLNLNASIQEKTLPEYGARSERGGFDLNLEASRIVGGEFGLENGEGVKLPKKGSGRLNFMEDDDDINIVVEERDNKDDELVKKDINLMEKQENTYNSADRNENTVNLTGRSVVAQGGSEQMIPGLSGRLENHGGSNFDNEWESDDSEDDLQIVLNDNNLGPMGMERMPGMDDEDDEEGEPLVIVADNGDVGHHHNHQHMMMEEQEWGGEEVGPGVDGERNEDASKPSGGGAGTAPPAAVQPKIGYSNHVYHHPFHLQFKYVRPGATAIPGAAPCTPGGIPGQVRPPVTIGAVAGRERGDWRPPGIKGAVPVQKGFHPGHGMPAWGANSAGRGYGTGLDFTLPSHKTIFEVDIEGFEEKPWRLPGIDISDFFNFGLNEDSWKDYCKQLEQLRLETTMQIKIRVYESGRAEQEYDPDLPPELAAAVGNQDSPSENAGKTDAGPIDLARQPIGRPIPVETGSGDRLPSITRRPRMHDADAIIEIVCHSSTDDDDMAEQQDNDLAGEDLEGVGEIDDLQQDDSEHIDRLSHAYNDRKRGLVARGAQFKNTINGDEIGIEVPVQDHPDREICIPHEESKRGHVKSPRVADSDNKRRKQIMDDENDKSFDSNNGKHSPSLSSSDAIVSDEEQAIAVGDDVNDESVLDDRSFNVEREERVVGATTSDALKDGNLMHSTKKQKFSSHGEQFSPENDDVEDSKAARSSENNKARSGSSKDHWRWRDEDVQGRRIKAEDTRNKIGSRNRGVVTESERSEKDDYYQSKNQVENGSWRGANHNQGMGSRKRDRDDNIKTRNEKVDDGRSKRRKEGAHISREHAEKEEIAYNYRESSNRRKRERDDGSDQQRRDDHGRLKEDDVHYVRQKEEGSFERERTDRHRDRDEWTRLKKSHEEILSRREREETRPVMRSGRAEDKTWISHSRGKDNYGGSSKEYHLKDVGWHRNHSKRRDRVENESFPQHRGHEDVYARGNQFSNDEKRARYERPGTNDECADAYASDTSRAYEHRQKKGSRKSKESESGDRSSSIPSKRNQDELGGHISETVNLRGRTEQESSENEIHASSRKQGEEEAPSDSEQTNSRKGHSKFERWDFSIISNSSSSLKNKDVNNSGGASSVTRFLDEPSNKVDDKDLGIEMNIGNGNGNIL